MENLEMKERKIIDIRARGTEMNSKEGAKFQDARQFRPTDNTPSSINYKNKRFDESR